LRFGFDKPEGVTLVGGSAGSFVRKVAPAKDGAPGIMGWETKQLDYWGGEIGIGRERSPRVERGEGRGVLRR
jgi:hypothetical protein